MAQRKAGKIIDTFRYRERGADIEISMRLVKNEDQAFTYLVDHDNPRIKLEDKDPNALRRRVFEELNKKVTVNWQPMIVVRTDIDRMEHFGWSSNSCDFLRGLEGKRSLSIDVRGYEIGTTHGDKPVYRFHALRTSSVVANDTTQTGSPTDREDGAMIPDTEENREKLESIIKAFEALGRQLHELLDQKHITATLTNVRTLGLPAPKGEAS